MRNSDIILAMQVLGRRRLGWTMLLLAACVAGCQTTPKSQRQTATVYADEIRRLDTADVDAEVAARTNQGNWRLLEFYSDDPEGRTVPGLTPEEGKELLESGLFETEVFFDQRTLYVFQFEGDPKPWIDAKWRYAEKMNQALARKIGRTGRVSARLAVPSPSEKTAN